MSAEGAKHRLQPCSWTDGENPDGLPGFKVPTKGALIKFDARVRHGVLLLCRLTLSFQIRLRTGFGRHISHSLPIQPASASWPGSSLQ